MSHRRDYNRLSGGSELSILPRKDDGAPSFEQINLIHDASGPSDRSNLNPNPFPSFQYPPPPEHEHNPRLRRIRTPTSPLTLWHFPTIFPIVFAAAAVNFLKALAAWKLERGISVLSLEFLLSSRTVFSTIASPMALSAAALRVTGSAPSFELNPWKGRYVEFRGELPFQEGPGSVPHSLPAVIATFGAALASSNDVKTAGQDSFGHVKIPMIESVTNFPDDDGWIDVTDGGALYSSLSGLPIASNEPFGRHSNFSFNLTTSYMYTDCKLSHFPSMNISLWKQALDVLPKNGPSTEADNKYHNGLTMVIEVLKKYNDTTGTPMQLNFTSYTFNATTSAICNLTTSYVEVSVKCHKSDCGAFRVREMKNDYDAASTVLNGLAPSGDMEFYDEQYWSYLGYFINSSNILWDWEPDKEPYSSPIELYLTHPDIPYAVLPNDRNWRGEDIWPVGNKLFSARFSQLLNSFWLAQIAPFAPMGRVNLTIADKLQKELKTLKWEDVDGTSTPDELVLKAQKPWLGTLIIASFVMLSVAIAAALLNIRRKGPDILDYATSMIRDNPYVNVEGIGEKGKLDGGRRRQNEATHEYETEKISMAPALRMTRSSKRSYQFFCTFL
ncbi:hypothetical protein CEP52_002969 [Fusarium oligoseptatum]|uniref:Uncharacterized protein n=1 Tax=Fusarium oligoseptatum TaxID=2604345 RepID=A0A428UAU9_9HYPO|nr:hypothetical protein CEP52_002969 [Fusarium oligoseptatum]